MGIPKYNRINTFDIVRYVSNLTFGSHVKKHIALTISISGDRGLFTDIKKIADITELTTRSVKDSINQLIESGVVIAFLRATGEQVKSISLGKQYVIRIDTTNVVEREDSEDDDALRRARQPYQARQQTPAYNKPAAQPPNGQAPRRRNVNYITRREQ